MEKLGCGCQKLFPEHSFGCFPSPYHHMFISQKKIWSKKNQYFDPILTSKYKKFGPPKYFLRYEHMVIGEGKASKKVLWKQFLALTNQFFRWIFKFEKKIFFEILGSKKSQNMIFELRVEKIVLGQKT